MSELLDKQVDVQLGSLKIYIPGFTAKCAMKMKEKKQRALKNNFCGWNNLIVLLEKTAWTDFNELQETDSSYIKGTIYNTSNYFRLKEMIPRAWAHERAP